MSNASRQWITRNVYSPEIGIDMVAAQNILLLGAGARAGEIEMTKRGIIHGAE